MEMREWLSIIVIVVLILIILDGFRRRWIDRKNRVLLKIDKNLSSNKGNGDDINPELPGSGVRTSTRSDVDDDDYGYNEEADESLSYDEDSTADENFYENSSNQEKTFERIEPSFSSGDSADGYADDHEDGYEDDYDDEFSDEGEGNHLKEGVAIPNELIKESKPQSIPFSQADLLFEGGTEAESDVAQITEVIVINVMAKKPQLFQGKAMLPILLQLGMRLGDMSIFHRHADSNGEGPIMFSMANIVEPGIFEMGSMDDFTTPGISFFLQLPNSLGNMESFEKMLEATNTLKDKLGGELKDENRSVITRQTIEHCRQRIRDFELALLANK